MTDRIVHLARAIERQEVQRRILMDVVKAIMDDRVLDAANHVAALDRPYLETLTTRAITVLELAKQRVEELELREQAGGTYSDMDEPA